MEKNHTAGEGAMNTATYEALRKVGATEEQAIVIATTIPDIEPLRKELRWIKWSIVVMVAFVGANVALASISLLR